MSQEEWKALRSSEEDKTETLKKADKGSCVVVWGREDYLKEAYEQLLDINIYRDVNYNESILRDLAETNNILFTSLKARGYISNEQLKYFSIEKKKCTNLGKMYLFPKIHKRLSSVPGRPDISNCGTPTEKVSEFLDSQLKSLMQSGKSYIKDSGDFIEKIKSLKNLPESAILVTADVVGIYPSIPHDNGLEVLERRLEQRKEKTIPTQDLIKMADFVLKNNFFGTEDG